MLSVITTPRLCLRPLVTADLAAYQALISNSLVAEPAGLQVPASARQARASLAADLVQPVHYVVCLAGTQRVVGLLMGYEHGDETGFPDPHALDLGYLLTPDQWGQGLIPEAVRAWLTQLPTQLPLVTTVWAATLATNQRSQRVLIKSAFELFDDQMMVPSAVDWRLERQLLYRYLLTNEKIMSK